MAQPVPVSVVMITRNRRDEAVANVARLRALPERPPVIVVDNASDDGTAEAVRVAHDDVLVLRLDENLGAAARNVGVRAAGTPYVAFADDDSWWRPGALARAAAVLDERPTLAVLAAAIHVGKERVLDATCAAMAASPLPTPRGAPGPAILGFIACGAVVRREAFLGAGGFDPMLQVGGEERVLALDLAAAGWELCYVADVVAVHEPSAARDREARARVVARNDLWTSWLRRPWRAAARDTAAAVVAALRSRPRRAGLIEAVAGAPVVLRRRRVVPRAVERQLRLIER